MKFCDKLLSLRKKNNLSQEQLADKLGVTRQAISKWESNQSIPDMEKIMKLCEILDCSLDELVDDCATGNKNVKNTKLNVNDYMKEFLNFITKTFNMFWSMTLTEKIKCLLEMGFIILILFILSMIIGTLLSTCIVSPILGLLPDNLYYIIFNILEGIYYIVVFIISIIVVIHLFKIRYLDYFITIEDKEAIQKTVEVPVDELEAERKDSDDKKRVFMEKKKNKIIIRDPKHTTYNFFYILARFAVYVIKIFLAFCAIPAIIGMVMFTFILIMALINIRFGLFFGGIVIGIIGFIVICYVILELIYNFIFNQKQHFKRILILFVVSLLSIGIGIGMSFNAYINFDKIDIKNDSVKTHFEVEMNDDLYLSSLDYGNTEIIIDNSLDNILIDVAHSVYSDVYMDNDKTWNSVHIISNLDGIDAFKNIIEITKNKQRIDIDDYSYYVIIHISQSNLDKLLENLDR